MHRARGVCRVVSTFEDSTVYLPLRVFLHDIGTLQHKVHICTLYNDSLSVWGAERYAPSRNGGSRISTFLRGAPETLQLLAQAFTTLGKNPGKGERKNASQNVSRKQGHCSSSERVSSMKQK